MEALGLRKEEGQSQGQPSNQKSDLAREGEVRWFQLWGKYLGLGAKVVCLLSCPAGVTGKNETGFQKGLAHGLPALWPVPALSRSLVSWGPERSGPGHPTLETGCCPSWVSLGYQGHVFFLTQCLDLS